MVDSDQLAGGLVLLALGLFLVLRSVVKDAAGHTLVDRVLAL